VVSGSSSFDFDTGSTPSLDGLTVEHKGEGVSHKVPIVENLLIPLPRPSLV